MIARYVDDIATRLSPEKADGVLTDYLTNEGFKRTDYGGERVWRKGIGPTRGPHFIKATPSAGSVRLEAWLKRLPLPGRRGGEIGIEGSYAIVEKRRLRKHVEAIEQKLGSG